MIPNLLRAKSVSSNATSPSLSDADIHFSIFLAMPPSASTEDIDQADPPFLPL